MKVARIQMTSELNRWDKMLIKYEVSMKKDSVLSHATRTLVESSARLSQETISSNMSLVLAALMRWFSFVVTIMVRRSHTPGCRTS